MFSFLSHVYGLSSPTGDDLTPFKLDYKAQGELLGLAILAPFCVCSLVVSAKLRSTRTFLGRCTGWRIDAGSGPNSCN